MNKPQNIALLLAGGNGQRMHFDRPKQYMPVAGRPILAYTMEAFATHPNVNGLYVVCTSEWQGFVTEWGHLIAGEKFFGTFEAGKTGFGSLCSGVKGLVHTAFSADTVVMVHDGVRPLVSHRIISSSINTCLHHGNAIAALRSNEAFMKTENGIYAQGCQSRDSLCLAQTPQTLPLSVLTNLLDEAKQRGITQAQSLYTLMAELGKWPVYLSHGETTNIKITYPEDLNIIQALLTGGWSMY